MAGGTDERHFRLRKTAVWGPWTRLIDSADPDAASRINISDAGGNFTAANVEDALAEEADARQAFEATKGQADGLAPLDANAKIPTTYLPALSITDVNVVASEAEQLALTVQEGDVAVRSDISTSYIHNGGTAGTMADWTELQTPPDAVLSVFGRTGAVNAQSGDYTAAQIPITDAGGVFTAAEVESALAELAAAGIAHQTDPNPHPQYATDSDLSTHTGDGAAHGSTSAATAYAIMRRDSAGRAKVAPPVAGDDIATGERSLSTISNSTDTGSATCAHTLQVNASRYSFASGYESQVNASDNSTASAFNSQVNACVSGLASGFLSQVNSSLFSQGDGDATVVFASSNVINSKWYSVAGGYEGIGPPSTANQQWRLESQGGTGRFDGGTTTGGFDFAEYFPNLTGGIIPFGTLVSRVGRAVRPAERGEEVVGVVSATAAVIGNASDFCWAGRHIKGEFGEVLTKKMEMVRWMSEDPDIGRYEGPVDEAPNPIPAEALKYEMEMPVENPDWDPEREQASRGERPEEWSVIGLLGQVYTRIDGSVRPDDYLAADGGIGTASDTPSRLQVMEITTPYDSQRGYGVALCLLR